MHLDYYWLKSSHITNTLENYWHKHLWFNFCVLFSLKSSSLPKPVLMTGGSKQMYGGKGRREHRREAENRIRCNSFWKLTLAGAPLCYHMRRWLHHHGLHENNEELWTSKSTRDNADSFPLSLCILVPFCSCDRTVCPKVTEGRKELIFA